MTRSLKTGFWVVDEWHVIESCLYVTEKRVGKGMERRREM